MGEDVVLVPGQLLGEEPPDAAPPHDLGQGGRVAEDVGQPDVLGLDPELAQIEPLAVEDLADQRLPRGDVAVGFDPHAAGRLQTAFGDPHLHPLPEVGVVVTHPGQVLGLGDHEPVLGIAVHELEHGAEGAGALADSSRGGATARPCPDGRGPPMLTDGCGGRRLRPAVRPAPAGPAASCRAMSGSSSRLQARSSPAHSRAKWGSPSGSSVSRSTRTRKSCQKWSNSGSRTCRSARWRVNSGAPSGSGSSSGHGLAPNGEGGLAAAST